MAGSFIGRIKVLLGLDSGQFQKGVSNSQKKMSGFQKFSKSWAGKMTGIIAGAFAVDAIKDFVGEASKMAGEMEGVKKAFEGLNDPTLLDRLKQATKGTVSELELMKSAVKAKNLGLPVQELAGYFEFARRRAKETGESVDFLVESIVTGIGRKSPLILDNLGISASALSEEFKKTGDFGAAAGKIISEEMANMGPDIDTAAEAQARMAANWDNIKVKAGELFNYISGPFIAGLSKTFDQFNTLIEDETISTFDKFMIALQPAKSAVYNFNKELENSIKAATSLDSVQKNLSTSVKLLHATYASGGITLQEYNAEKDKLIAAAKKTSTQLKAQKGAAIQAAEGIKVLTDEEKKAAEEAEKLRRKLENLQLKTDFIPADVEKLKGIRGAVDKVFQEIRDEGAKPRQVKIRVAPDLEITNTEGLEKEVSQKMITLGQNISAATGQLFQDMAGTMIDAMAAAFSGASAEDIGRGLLTSLADLLGQFGKMLITLGLSMEALKLSLELGPGGGLIAIGAGVALIAAAGAVKGFLKDSSSNIGGASGGGASGGGGGGVGLNGGDYDNTGSEGLRQMQTPSPNDAMKDFQFTLRGKDLVATTNRFENTNKLTTG